MTGTRIVRNITKVVARSAVVGVMGMSALATGAGVASADDLDPSTPSAAEGGGAPSGAGSSPSDSSTADTPGTPAGGGDEPAETRSAPDLMEEAQRIKAQSDAGLVTLGGKTYTQQQMADMQDAARAYADANPDQFPANPGPSGSGHEPADDNAPRDPSVDYSAQMTADMMDIMRDVREKMAQIQAAQQETLREVSRP